MSVAMSDVQDPTVESQVRDSAAPSAPSESAAPEAAADLTPEQQLQAALDEGAKYKDQLLRTLADLDNVRKRSRKEVEDAYKSGQSGLLKEFLPVFDNLERALKSAETATEVKAVAEGLSLVLRQFGDTLTKSGIRRTPGVGEPFDPQFQEAIQQVETDEHAPGTVIAEVQPGYVQGDRLVRAAMVVVSKAKG